MSIIRSPRKQKFTSISNDVWSRNLSFRAIGLLTYLLSKPDHWEVSVAHLVKIASTTAKPEGRDTIYGILNELIGAGFVSRTKNRAGAGKLNGYDYEVHDTSVKDDNSTSQTTTATKKRPKSADVGIKSSVSPYPAQPYTVQPYPAQPYPAEPTQVNTDSKLNTEKRINTDAVSEFSPKSGRKKVPSPEDLDYVRSRVKASKEPAIPAKP